MRCCFYESEVVNYNIVLGRLNLPDTLKILLTLVVHSVSKDVIALPTTPLQYEHAVRLVFVSRSQ